MAAFGLKPTIWCCLSNSGILSSLIWTPTTDLTVLVSVFHCLLPSFLISILSASKGPVLKHKYDHTTPTFVKAPSTPHHLALPTHPTPSAVIVLELMLYTVILLVLAQLAMHSHSCFSFCLKHPSFLIPCFPPVSADGHIILPSRSISVNIFLKCLLLFILLSLLLFFLLFFLLNSIYLVPTMCQTL